MWFFAAFVDLYDVNSFISTVFYFFFHWGDHRPQSAGTRSVFIEAIELEENAAKNKIRTLPILSIILIYKFPCTICDINFDVRSTEAVS